VEADNRECHLAGNGKPLISLISLIGRPPAIAKTRGSGGRNGKTTVGDYGVAGGTVGGRLSSRIRNSTTPLNKALLDLHDPAVSRAIGKINQQSNREPDGIAERPLFFLEFFRCERGIVPAIPTSDLGSRNQKEVRAGNERQQLQISKLRSSTTALPQATNGRVTDVK
jgi:hypothetical protein